MATASDDTAKPTMPTPLLLHIDLHYKLTPALGKSDQAKLLYQLHHSTRPKQVSLTFDYTSNEGNVALEQLVLLLTGSKTIYRLILIDLSEEQNATTARANRVAFFDWFSQHADQIHIRELVLKGGPIMIQEMTGLASFIVQNKTLSTLSMETSCCCATSSLSTIVEAVSRSNIRCLCATFGCYESMVSCIGLRLAQCVGLERVGLKFNGEIDKASFKSLMMLAIPKLIKLKVLEIDFGFIDDEGDPSHLESLREALFLSKIERLKVTTCAPIEILDPIIKTLKVFHYRQLNKTVASRDQEYLVAGLKGCTKLEEVGLQLPRCYVSPQVLDSLCTVLAQLPNLKRVTWLLGGHKWGNKQTREAISNLVKRSSSIQQLPPRHHFQGVFTTDAWEQISRYCRSNKMQRQAKQLLQNDNRMMSLVPRLFSKANNERVIYMMLRENPQVLCRRGV